MIIPARTALGQASDFLKQFPQYDLEDYKWKLSIPEIMLLQYDQTRVVYLPDKPDKKSKNKDKLKNGIKINSADDMIAAFGETSF